MAIILHLNRWKIYLWSKEKKDDIIKLCLVMSINSSFFLHSLALEGEKITCKQTYLGVFFFICFYITQSLTPIFFIPVSPGEELFMHNLKQLLFVFCRRQGEPPLENGFLPYLGCALQFGANPLEFLKEKQKKHGHIFTCHVAGKYIHFLTDPFSYHALMRQGKYLDWKKFHFATSAKVLLVLISNMKVSADIPS